MKNVKKSSIGSKAILPEIATANSTMLLGYASMLKCP